MKSELLVKDKKIALKTMSTVNEKLIGPNCLEQYGPIFMRIAGFRLLDRNLAAFDFDTFTTRQSFTVAVGESDKATAAAKFNRIACSNLQLGLAGAFGNDNGLSAGIAVLKAGCESWSGQNGACKNNNSKLFHFTPVLPPPLLSRAQRALFDSSYNGVKLNGN
ncbi:hypothetical protein FHW16_002327 [Phyllobacterium myrsinacearum]|uniref:Uncharacterized protein n=1 Tax=Phyllobacterium myrsinacearum TaxID=28101 RepID=A0A839EK36_9HYPH|nr:hypothetical protein [Phyllobacterium myrsinacearum]